MSESLPRILIVDDLFGRVAPDGINKDRENLCGSFLLKDVTNPKLHASRQKIRKPIADVIFCRGQKPAPAKPNDFVENDLPGTMDFIRQGWIGSGPKFKRWSLVLLDLCFYTGKVTGELSSAVAGETGKRAEPGMPEGRAEDIVPSKFFGLDLLRAIHAEFPDLPVVILSSQERGKVSQEFSAHGAKAFLPRSNDADGYELLQTYLDRHGLMEDPHGLIVGRSLPLLKALRAARLTAYTKERENILIRGERGVGKEEFARFIHRTHPSRAKKELVPINSAVLTSELFQSELFGIEKRKATGVDAHKGAAFRANGGDLFFDEIKDMIPQAQAGVLRFLEDGGYTPTGSKKLIESDVRVISATNADLESLAASGHFRDDLLDRLRGGASIVLPPLRERKEDIPLLARAFLIQTQAKVESGEVTLLRQFSNEAMACLIADDWPGNVRVLRDVINRVVRDNDVEYIYPAQIEKAKEDLGIAQSPAVSVVVPSAISQQHDGEIAVRLPVSDRLASNDDLAISPKTPLTPDGNITLPNSKEVTSLEDLVSIIRDFDFDLADRDGLRGKLDELDETAAGLVAKYLLAGLQITKDPVNGDLGITKAIQFVTGKKIATSSAADTIKRLLKRHPMARAVALEDPILKQAFDQAEKLRPTKSAKKKST